MRNIYLPDLQIEDEYIRMECIYKSLLGFTRVLCKCIRTNKEIRQGRSPKQARHVQSVLAFHSILLTLPITIAAANCPVQVS